MCIFLYLQPLLYIIFQQLPRPRIATTDASQRTIRNRTKTLQEAREKISKGGESAAAQMQDELQSSTKAEREELLKAAGLAPGEIEAGAGLAMKAELGIPWSKLRRRRCIPPLSLLRTHAY